VTEFKAERYWDERFSRHFDLRGVGDIGLSKGYNAWLYRIRRRIFRRAVDLISVSPSTAAVLDVGSGVGFYLDEWLAAGAARVAACDISATAVNQLRQRYPQVEVVKADISATESASILPGPFDVISCFDVLFHVVDDERYRTAIRSIAQRLTAGGWFLYSDNLVSHEARVTHYVSRPEALILETLEENGLMVVHRMPMFVLMNDPVRSRSRILRRFFSTVSRFAARNDLVGNAIGAALFPVEAVATRYVRRGPSTELLVCQKRMTALPA
jgi:2-polyprenyl-3-methyl-5-hydroxy-6-metoxy-1,4-benzoquinol methylase